MAKEIKPTSPTTPSPLVKQPPEDSHRKPAKKQDKEKSEKDDETTDKKQRGLFNEYV